MGSDGKGREDGAQVLLLELHVAKKLAITLAEKPQVLRTMAAMEVQVIRQVKTLCAGIASPVHPKQSPLVCLVVSGWCAGVLGNGKSLSSMIGS